MAVFTPSRTRTTRPLSRRTVGFENIFIVSVSRLNITFRWGVKEAAYKALYPTVVTTWKEMTYRRLGEVTSGQKPTLTYHPFKSDRVGKVGRIHVSVSHDGDYVFASVLVEHPK
jgi:phosphopantetheinyl transferase (holo-ACP synthase)